MGAGSTPVAPGLVLLPRQGSPRLLGRTLLEHLGLEELPSAATSMQALLAAAGFRRRSRDGGVWEREGRAVVAGETALEDGARLLWTFPVPWDEDSVREHVRYLGLASHDLRGSLANIRSYAALLLNGRSPLDAKVKRGLETILRNADRSLSFAQDFFDASRADLGSLPCEPERQSLLPLLDAAVERQRATATAANVTLVLDVDPQAGLPDVAVDGARIQHAVESFIQYQLLRAQAGEVIHLRVRPSPPHVRVEVRREGVPLSDDDASAVFLREERAFREKKLEDPLRIYLARQEVEAHGGGVGVETDRAGSTLFLTLFLAPSAELGPPASMQA
ncbi:sensor histidine kinase [Pyxidicoccus trucidator]|uniref:sensor histidine kinase n=1 Tax=Pyxidicoccus trucidator TaxID=2709662 RepID=UPI0013DA4CC4|nr:HAMP domain-containing sensor histidine kinase [Pyxidicoccus trucidator]